MAIRKSVLDRKYQFEYDVGMWTFGSIQVLTDKETGKQKTCKTVPKADLRVQSTTSVVSKLQALQDLQHPHISSITEVVEDQSNIYIISDFWQGGDVQDWMERLDDGNWLQEQTCAAYLRQVMVALAHSHAAQVYHNDLKPSNLALTTKLPDAVVKVSDIGIASILDPAGEKRRQHDSPYAIPEGFEPGGRTAGSADLWSVGAIAHRMLVGLSPSASSGKLGGWSLGTSQDEECWSERSTLSKDFVTRLLRPTGERHTAAKALNHPWLKGLTPINQLNWRADSELAKELAHKTLCYSLGVLMLPVIVPFRDFEQLRVAFQQSDVDHDGFVPRSVAQRLLLSRCNISEAVKPALNIVDVSKTDTLELSAVACADLIVREFFAAGPTASPLIGPFKGTDLAPRMLTRFFEVFGDRRNGAAQVSAVATAAAVKAKLRTATARELETHAGIRYDELVSCLPEDRIIDSQLLATQLSQSAGRGTPLGTDNPLSPVPGEDPWGSAFSFDVSNIFHSCGAGGSESRVKRSESPNSVRIF